MRTVPVVVSNTLIFAAGTAGRAVLGVGVGAGVVVEAGVVVGVGVGVSRLPPFPELVRVLVLRRAATDDWVVIVATTSTATPSAPTFRITTCANGEGLCSTYLGESCSLEWEKMLAGPRFHVDRFPATQCELPDDSK